MKPIIRAVIFTHGPDYAKALIATRSLEKLGVEVWWAVDQADPIEPPAHVRVKRTTFARNGNLNGIDCVIGILQVLRDVGRGAKWVMKIDSDAMVLSLDFLQARTERLVGMNHAPVRGPHALFGFCYALKPEAVGDFIVCAAVRGELPKRAEDMIMGELGAGLGCHQYPFHRWSGVFSAWSWETTLEVSDWIPRYQVLVVQPPKGAKREVGREQVRAMMQRIHDERWAITAISK